MRQLQKNVQIRTRAIWWVLTHRQWSLISADRANRELAGKSHIQVTGDYIDALNFKSSRLLKPGLFPAAMYYSSMSASFALAVVGAVSGGYLFTALGVALLIANRKSYRSYLDEQEQKIRH